MDKMERFRELQRLLEARRSPMPLKEIAERLECDPSTIKRLVAEFREKYDAPVASSRDGYSWRPRPDQRFELPGTWLGQRELLALMVIDNALAGFTSRVMESEFRTLRNRVRQMMKQGSVQGEDFIRRLRVVSSRQRATPLPFFPQLVEALHNRQQLQFDYFTRTRNSSETRTVSPQRLVLYRDNWYLDAWCHTRNALRTFSLDCIDHVHRLQAGAKHIADADLDQHYAHSYGIFSGAPVAVAEIEFNAEAARWARNERWHPEQQQQELPDGRLLLKVPYSNPTELIRDVLSYGAGATVRAPEALRAALREQLQQALQAYAAGA